MAHTRIRTIRRWTTGVLGVAAAAYAAYVATAWAGYGHGAQPHPEAADQLLDQFMPNYDIVERHRIQVAAPAETTFAAARDMDLNDSWVVRAIFRTREVMLGAEPDKATRPRASSHSRPQSAGAWSPKWQVL